MSEEGRGGDRLSGRLHEDSVRYVHQPTGHNQ